MLVFRILTIADIQTDNQGANLSSNIEDICRAWVGSGGFISKMMSALVRKLLISHKLEMLLQLYKLFHLQQLQPFWSRIYRLMLQHPGKIMRHKDGVDARGQRRVDV
jgi:hypothetical protein